MRRTMTLLALTLVLPGSLMAVGVSVLLGARNHANKGVTQVEFTRVELPAKPDPVAQRVIRYRGKQRLWMILRYEDGALGLLRYASDGSILEQRVYGPPCHAESLAGQESEVPHWDYAKAVWPDEKSLLHRHLRWAFRAEGKGRESFTAYYEPVSSQADQSSTRLQLRKFFENGRLTYAETFRPDGSLESVWKHSNDGGSRFVTFAEDGRTRVSAVDTSLGGLQTGTLFYEGGVSARAVFVQKGADATLASEYRRDGTVFLERLYTYNTKGQNVVVTVYDESGTRKLFEQSWQSFVNSGPVLVKLVEYDGDEKEWRSSQFNENGRLVVVTTNTAGGGMVRRLIDEEGEVYLQTVSDKDNNTLSEEKFIADQTQPAEALPAELLAEIPYTQPTVGVPLSPPAYNYHY